jgi:acyl-CoA synthetase (AMP-forming)/AMP-acid ligase II
MHPKIHAKTNPAKPAYIMASTGEVVTYGELDARSNRWAQFFRGAGLGIGSGIAIFMENNAQYLEIVWGAQRSGLYFTAISSRLTASEVAYIVSDCNAGVFITSNGLSAVALELVDLMPGVSQRLVVGGAIEGYQSFEDALAPYSSDPISDESQGTDMLYSSGTTGRPKGVKRALTGDPPEAPGSLSVLAKMLYDFSDQTVYLSPAPLYHAAPLRYCMTVHGFGGTVIVMEHFDAEQALKLIAQYKVTHSQWVPTMFVRLLKLPEDVRGRYDLSSHKVAIHAAAPCPVSVKEQMIAWWGPIIFEYYAGTEGNGFCAINSTEWLSHKGSVGRAMLGTIRIVGEHGDVLPANEPGTIYFEGGPQFQYHNDPGRTGDAYNTKGWSTLGDVGQVDEEGYLYLTDRKAFMIISGGVNIYPQETENILIAHPAVADVAVIGVPNEDFGEEVKAVVQPVDMALAGPALAEELMAYCRKHLSPIKCPRSIDFDPELPRHATGKLYKRLVRDRYWGNRTSKIV